MKIRPSAIFTAVLMASLLVLSACGEVKDGKYADIAKCLTEKGVKMYGAYWCSHCAEQKQLFGADVRYIDYIECDPRGPNPKREECVAAGVQAYPSWGFPGQELEVGTREPIDLAKKANCELGDLEDQAATASGTVTAVPITTEAQPL